MSAKSRLKRKPKQQRLCSRCDRRLRGAGDDWAASITDADYNGYGIVTEVYCADCTTFEERLIREINDSTNNYVWRDGRVALWPKTTTIPALN
jgi:hypothetical protein